MADHNINEIIKNIENLSNKDKISHLFDIIDEEKNKPWDQIDFGKIEACSQYINELTKNDETQLSPAKIDFIKAKNDERARMAQNRQFNRRFSKRLAVAAAAAVIILTSFAALSVVAASQGYASAFEYVSAMAQALFNMNDGEVVEDGNITVIRNGNTERYSSIKDFVDECNLDIMYPTNLPEGLTIQNVVMADFGDGKVCINFILNNTNNSLLVNNYYSTNQEYLTNNNCAILKTNYGIFYVVKKNITYQGICYKENNEYIIYADNYDHLVALIDSLGG